MGKSYSGDFTFNAAFDVNAGKPIDTRLVVDALTDLTNSISYPYVGLLVYVKGEGKYYSYKETSSNVFGWVELASGGGSGTITSVKVGSTTYNPTNGVVSLPAYPTIPSSLPASDVYAWAKASSKPSYTLDEVSDGSTRKLANYLPLAGGTMTGLITAKTGASHTGIKFANAYITALSNDVIFQNNNAIRFGTDAWDYNEWAGLKYVHSTKSIYLGIADGSIFTANSAQKDGSIIFPNVTKFYLKDIYYTGTKATHRMIQFIDNTNDAYGNGIAIGGGGQTIIGGGESASVAVANLGNSGLEVMYITNDSGNISFVPNTDSGWANRKESYFDASGNLYVNNNIYAATKQVATQEWVTNKGYTTNTGTVTSVKVGTTSYSPSSGVVSLPAYPTVPTKVSQLTNDSGFIASVPAASSSTRGGAKIYASGDILYISTQ